MKLKILLFLIFCTGMVYGQNQTDSINFKNAQWQKTKIAKKVFLRQYHFNRCELFNANQYVTVLEISKKSKLKIDLAYQDHELIALSKIAKSKSAIAGLNGTFFDTKNGGSVDYIRSDGKQVNENFINKSGERADHQKAAIVFNNRKLHIETWDGKANWEKNLTGEDVMLTGPILRIEDKDASLSNNVFNNTRHPRTLVGVKPNGNILWITIDGRDINAEGMTMKEEQLLTRWLGCAAAVNLDGGGSTAMYIKGMADGGIVNYPSDDRIWDHLGERKIANGLLLVK